MHRVDGNIVAARLREVVADEPKAFAYDLGLSLSAVYNYMNGRVPTTEVLYRISQYTGRPMEWFLTPPPTLGGHLNGATGFSRSPIAA